MDAARRKRKRTGLVSMLAAAVLAFGTLYLSFGQKKLEKAWSSHSSYCGHHGDHSEK